MADSIKVKILEFFGPSKFSVRPNLLEGSFHSLQRQMDQHFFHLHCNPSQSSEERLPVKQGDSVSVYHNNHWCRAVIHRFSSEDKQHLRLRLVDLGMFVEAPSDDVTNLPDQFLKEAGMAIWCHLESVILAEDLQSSILSHVMKELPEDRMVAVVKRGEPLEVGGYYSLPADLTWTTTSVPSPLAPCHTFSHSLTDIVLEKMGVSTSLDCLNNNNPLELEAVPDQGEEEEEDFSWVLPLEDTEGFRWLPPELPRKNVFKARGWFVDGSGQMFVQVYSQRHTLRLIKKLLNQKFQSSSGEEEREALRVGQDCCAQWRDGNWYRARVVTILQDGAHCDLYLVDHGNAFRAKLADIRREVFAHQIPIQVLKVELAGVRPLGPGHTWPDRALEFLLEEIQNRKLKVELVDRTRQPPTVRVTTDQKFDLATMLYNLEGDFVELVADCPLSSQLMAVRAASDVGIEAVPAGNYQESNPYLLLQTSVTSVSSLLPGESQSEVISYLDWSRAGLQPQDLLRVKIVEVANFKTLYLHPDDSSSQYLVDVFAQHEKTFQELQRECERQPPVFQPREGSLVVAQYSDQNNSEGWYRARILSWGDQDVVVNFLDYGTTSTISDGRKIRKIPPSFCDLPVLAIKLELPLERKEEEEIALTLMLEELYSEERNVMVRIASLGEEGTLRGHLVVEDTEEIVYRSLMKEGIIKSLL